MNYKHILRLQDKSLMLIPYYLALLLFINYIFFEKRYAENDTMLFNYMLVFLCLAPVAFWVLLQKPIIEVHIKQTIISPKPRWNVNQFLLIGVCLFFLIGFLFLFFNTGSLVAANNSLVSGWKYKEASLINVCEIDYNSYLKVSKEKVWQDFNLLPSPVFDFNV